MTVDLERLNRLDQEIQRIAIEFGLDFFPQKFDIIRSDKMLEFMAYGFPNNFNWWGFGRDYEILRKKFENAATSVPFEVVYNLNPSRAYVIKDMPLALQILTMAHVYAHNDFMKNNVFFGKTNRNILSSASCARERFLEYERRYGIDAVEKMIDAAMSIEINVNPDLEQDPECEENKRKRLLKELATGLTDPAKATGLKQKRRQKELEDLRDALKNKSPLEPEQDILFYLIDKAPLEDWQKDILSVIWEQARYHMPQRRTQIMNEGWASYWHVLIMRRLHDEKLITDEEFETFNIWSSRVLTVNYLPYNFNPYTIGVEIWRNIKDRWDKGRFGKDFDECTDAHERSSWDKQLGKGTEKIFEVARTYCSTNFIDEFLTKDLIDEIRLYFYGLATDEKGKPIVQNGQPMIKVVSRNWQKVRRFILSRLVNFGAPFITVEDGKHEDEMLYLKHHWEGIGLDAEYREGTMAHLFYLWKKPICVETVEIVTDSKGEIERVERVVYTYDGDKYDEKILSLINEEEFEKIIANSPFKY